MAEPLSLNPQAASALYRAVRQFSVMTSPWETAAWYETKPDEMYDLTLVSERVYGTRTEALTVMAAAGLSDLDEPLTERKLCLPTAGQLRQIKAVVGAG